MTNIVFPGQGSQFVGMGRDFYQEFQEVKDIFSLVEDTTEIKIKDIIFNNFNNLIDITQFTQLAIFTTSISIYNVLIKEASKKKLNIKTILGHSLGEYTALVASNVISLKTCSKLLKLRGELMQNAYKENLSGMCAIIGKNCEDIENIILDNNLSINVANDNSPLQVVVSGTKENLFKAEPIFINNGVKKYIHLNVSAAFHSPLMIDAEEKMKNQLNLLNFKNPLYDIVSNYSGQKSNDISVIYANLTNQISNKVKWVDSIKCLENEDKNDYIEIGPGKILSGLIKRISKKSKITNINSVDDLNKYINEL